MSMLVTDLFEKKNEQINNKGAEPAFSHDLSHRIYSGVKKILENDRFNLFGTKEKLSYDIRIKRLASKIDKYIKLNVKGKESVKSLTLKLKKMRSENDEITSELWGKIK